jgi:hypothetical protein
MQKIEFLLPCFSNMSLFLFCQKSLKSLCFILVILHRRMALGKMAKKWKTWKTRHHTILHTICTSDEMCNIFRLLRIFIMAYNEKMREREGIYILRIMLRSFKWRLCGFFMGNNINIYNRNSLWLLFMDYHGVFVCASSGPWIEELFCFGMLQKLFIIWTNKKRRKKISTLSLKSIFLSDKDLH